MVHVHPASVHFPIAYLVLGSALDIGRILVPGLVSKWSLTQNLNLSELAHFLHIVGLAASVPAIATGVLEIVKTAKKQGLYEPDTGKLRKKIWVSAIHAVFTGIAIAGIAVASCFRDALALEAQWNVTLEALSIGLLLYGAKLGGALAFEYGMGFSVKTNPTKQS